MWSKLLSWATVELSCGWQVQDGGPEMGEQSREWAEPSCLGTCLAAMVHPPSQDLLLVAGALRSRLGILLHPVPHLQLATGTELHGGPLWRQLWEGHAWQQLRMPTSITGARAQKCLTWNVLLAFTRTEKEPFRCTKSLTSNQQKSRAILWLACSEGGTGKGPGTWQTAGHSFSLGSFSSEWPGCLLGTGAPV